MYKNKTYCDKDRADNPILTVFHGIILCYYTNKNIGSLKSICTTLLLSKINIVFDDPTCDALCSISTSVLLLTLVI